MQSTVSGDLPSKTEGKQTEIRHLCTSSHRYIDGAPPRNTQVLQDAEYVYVVLPFYNGGELFSVVSASRGLSEEAARPIFRGLLAGMAFLHGLQICHR